MALRTTQVAFDLTIDDVEQKVLGHTMGSGHKGLLRSFFQRDVGPSIPKTTTLTPDQQMVIAKKTQAIFRHHCWTNLDDPCWEFVIPRMIKHLKDVATSRKPVAASSDPKGGIPRWAAPPPRSKHVKGSKVRCALCSERIIAPLDHLAYQHGVDTPANRYIARKAHIIKMHAHVVVQHLVQDGGELNRLRAGILAAERKLFRIDPGYESKHGLLLHIRHQTDCHHATFRLNRDRGPLKEDLVERLFALRQRGLQRGQLYTRNGTGTYGEVLADLEEVLARAEEKQGGPVGDDEAEGDGCEGNGCEDNCWEDDGAEDSGTDQA